MSFNVFLPTISIIYLGLSLYWEIIISIVPSILFLAPCLIAIDKKSFLFNYFWHASGRYWNNFLNYLWRNFPVGALVINQIALSTFRRCLTFCTLAAHDP
jgi:hypothetical protein